jgi:hypothetical protein
MLWFGGFKANIRSMLCDLKDSRTIWNIRHVITYDVAVVPVTQEGCEAIGSETYSALGIFGDVANIGRDYALSSVT